jgi:hypothetical protein
MILGKFKSGARPGTWSNRLLKFRCKSIIKECKNEVKNENFKIFFIYILCRWIFLPIKAKILRFLCQKQKFCLSRDQNQ